jgi:transposase
VVSVQPQPWPEIPQATVRAARAAARKGDYPLAMRVRDELGELFADAEFAEVFGARGRPGWSPGRLALVLVLQKVENLTDRAAAARVRYGMDWKYALGLELDDEGFDPTVLSEFRSKVAGHGLEEKALDLLLEKLAGKGLLGAGGKQRTDSTHVLAAVRDLNRLELAGEAVRAALEALAAAEPRWVAARLDVAGWGGRYRRRVDSWRLPTSAAKRDELALAYGRDGFALLEAVYAPPAPGWLAELPAVEALRVVLVQNYLRTTGEDGREVVKRREATDGLPPGRCRLTSPYDTDARCGGKRDMYWNGYKVHISETCGETAATPAEAGGATGGEQDDAGAGVPQARRTPRPHLVTNVATTDASVADAAMTAPIHRQLAARRLTPDRHYVDSGYPSADLLVSTSAEFGITLVTPLLADTSPQARAGAGFDRTAFTVDFDTEQVTCPQGATSASWTPCRQRGTEAIVVRFAGADCQPCPVRPQCTTATRQGRQLTLRPQAVQQALDQARAEQDTKQWQADYALRAGVEGTMHQAVAATGIRRSRYRGLVKTHLDHVNSAAALNLIRLDAYWNDTPLDRTRTSHLARLELAQAA